MLAPQATAFHWTQELAGRFDLDIRAYPDTDLDAVYAAVEKALVRFEETGVPADELRRVKAGYETSFYSRLSSTLGKALRLAQHSMLVDDVHQGQAARGVELRPGGSAGTRAGRFRAG
jgi:zinc protease